MRLSGWREADFSLRTKGVLLDAFQSEKRAVAMTIFAVGALLAPVFGPTLGGYITLNFLVLLMRRSVAEKCTHIAAE